MSCNRRKKTKQRYSRSFLSKHIAGFGVSPEMILKKYNSSPRIVQGVPAKSVRRDIYLWLTTSHASNIPISWQKKQDTIILKHNIIKHNKWGKISPQYTKLVKDWNFTGIVIHHSGDWGRKEALEIEQKHKEENYDDIGCFKKGVGFKCSLKL